MEPDEVARRHELVKQELARQRRRRRPGPEPRSTMTERTGVIVGISRPITVEQAEAMTAGLSSLFPGVVFAVVEYADSVAFPMPPPPEEEP